MFETYLKFAFLRTAQVFDFDKSFYPDTKIEFHPELQLITELVQVLNNETFERYITRLNLTQVTAEAIQRTTSKKISYINPVSYSRIVRDINKTYHQYFEDVPAELSAAQNLPRLFPNPVDALLAGLYAHTKRTPSNTADNSFRLLIACIMDLKGTHSIPATIKGINTTDTRKLVSLNTGSPLEVNLCNRTLMLINNEIDSLLHSKDTIKRWHTINIKAGDNFPIYSPKLVNGSHFTFIDTKVCV